MRRRQPGRYGRRARRWPGPPARGDGGVGVQADPLAFRFPVQVDGELRVDEVPAGDVEFPGEAVAAVGDGEHPLKRAGLLIRHQRVAQPCPDAGGPWLGESSLDRTPLDGGKEPVDPARGRRRPDSPRPGGLRGGLPGGPASAAVLSTRQPLALATSRPPALAVAWSSSTLRPGRARAATLISPTGIGRRISQVNRAIIMSWRGEHSCMARPSSALGGPPCWALASHGPVVCTVACHRPSPAGRRSYRPRVECYRPVSASRAPGPAAVSGGRLDDDLQAGTGGRSGR